MRSEEKIEKLYDEKIAPALMEIAKVCKDNDIPFMAVVEYAPDELATTAVRTKDEGLKMIMIRHCANTAPNIDSFCIGLTRWAKEKGVDVSGSMYLSKFGK